MPNPKPPFSFQRPFPWSLLKLEVLSKYADVLPSVVGGWAPAICFVDLMAGEGYYQSGESGSTGHFVAIAQRHLENGRNVRAIAFEANATAFGRLTANTEAVRSFVSVRQGKWEPHVPALLGELADDFAFFFVDPMGVRDISWTALEPLVKRAPSELLINFNSVVAARLAGKALEQGDDCGEYRRLLTVMGGDYWVPGAGAARNSGTLGRYMAQQYAEFLAGAGGYTVSSGLVREFGLHGRPKYHLVFASRNTRAFQIMNDILYAQRERLLAEERPRLGPLFEGLDEFADTYSSEREEALVLELTNSLANDERLRGRAVSIEQLFDIAFRSRFAEYKKALYVRAATALVDQGRASVIGEERRRKLPGTAAKALLWPTVVTIR